MRAARSAQRVREARCAHARAFDVCLYYTACSAQSMIWRERDAQQQCKSVQRKERSAMPRARRSAQCNAMPCGGVSIWQRARGMPRCRRKLRVAVQKE